MKNTVKLAYNGVTVEHQLGTKALNNPAFRTNRINAMKRAFAEDLVTQQWLDANLITLEKNCITNDAGHIIKVVATKSLTPELLEKFEADISEVEKQIVILSE